MNNQIKIDIQKLIGIVAGAATGHGLIPEKMLASIHHHHDKPLIVVAAIPKSGSTFLTNTLIKLTGLRNFRLCAAYSTNEHDLYLPALCLMNRYGCVSQLHMKGTFHNAALMRQFGIKPIILVRRLYDVIVSLKHDLREKECMTGYGTGLNGYSFLWQDESLKNLNDEQLIDAIIDLAIPWYVNFYVSWHRLCDQGAVDAIWVSYEEMIAEKEKTLKTILNFIDVKYVGEIDQEILSAKYQKFRKGATGEGESALTRQQRTRINKLFSYYSDVDFSLFGL